MPSLTAGTGVLPLAAPDFATPEANVTAAIFSDTLPPDPASPRPALLTQHLAPGQDLGARYHIIRLLGRGGMGAVYQAWDKVLEVAVAIKVIRLEAVVDPAAADSLRRRFKRELLLARQVTHRNVVRIHDLGELDGITYITMPYVQGQDLATILKREGRLSVDRTVHIGRQVAAGLVAAHEAGVVHRDLKPANIMVDAEGGALIMDFGIARSTSTTDSGLGGGMTATGAVVGTVEYMAPEQARGEAVDHRADIYALGLILNDLLLGRRQSGGGSSTAVAELLERMQRAPASVRSIDATVPEWLDALVTRCLQPNPAARYQSMAELADELEAGDHSQSVAETAPQPMIAAPLASSAAAPATAAVTAVAQPLVTQQRPMWLWAGAAAVLLAAIGLGVWMQQPPPPPATESEAVAPAVPAGPSITLAIVPFRNASGDPTLDSLGPSLSQVLGTTLGESAHVRTVPSDRLYQVLRDLRITSNANLAPAELARVADFTNVRRVLWGQFTRFGEQIRIDATLQDLDRNQTVALNALAANEGALLTAIGELANAVRQELARGAPDVLAELTSTSWKPSTTSLEALRAYADGQQQTQQGAHQEALKSFAASIKADGNFALGYSALAQSYATLGYDNEAAQASRRAMTLSTALPAREQYLISANHYRIVDDTDKAIEAYETLAKASPNSASVQFDLGVLYENSGQLDQAQPHLERVVKLDPRFLEGLVALGRVQIRRGMAQASLEPLNAALTLAIDRENDEARSNILQAIGIAYKRLDRPQEALRRYQESLEIKQRLGNKRGMAASLNEIAQVQAALGQLKEAEVSNRSALTLQREIGDKSGTSNTLINLATLLVDNLGRPDDALPLLREALQLRRETGNRAGEAFVLNNMGTLYFTKSEFSEAQTYFERALELREKAQVPELADTVHNLAETLLRMGRFDGALTRYHRALELYRAAENRRGVAIESYSLGRVFDHQGRFGAAITSKREALDTYRALQLRDMWLGEMLGGYGYSLSLAGRRADAATALAEALQVANELQTPAIVAQTQRFLADSLMHAGDLAKARSVAEQGLQAATRTSDPSLRLQAEAQVAILESMGTPTKALAGRLQSIAQRAETLGLRPLAIESEIHRASVLAALGDAAGARREIERTIAKAEPLGVRILMARAHFVRGSILAPTDAAEAKRESAIALRLLNEVRAEDGNAAVLSRADLAPLHADAERRATAP